MKKVILAYSGGLDTSVAIPWLAQKGYDVIAFAADVGQGVDRAALRKKALGTGASKIYIEDLRQEFIEEYAFAALKADAVYEGKYLLATALSRPLIGKRLVEIAKKEKADFVAHGCTGKGNDQVRIETAVYTLGKNLKVIAPLREWELTTRESEIAYAKKHKIPIDVTKKSPYSIDKNLWGISIECGVLEDPNIEPPSEIYRMTKGIEKTPAKPEYLTIEFEQGAPVKLNGKRYSAIKLVSILNEKAGRHGIGRTDLVENRLVGIKSREIYESPAATVLFAAHKELEHIILDRELFHFKEQIALKYAEIIYYGLWFSPLKQALDGFIDKTQERVCGTVRLKFHKGQCIVVGRESKYSLYKKELATYEKGDKFDRGIAEGFIKVWAQPYLS